MVLAKKLMILEKDNHNIQVMASNREKELKVREKKYATLKQELASARQESSDLKKKNADLHQRNDELIDELQGHEKTYKESKEKLAKLNEELTNVKVQVVEKFKTSSEFRACIDEALEAFKSGEDGEQFVEDWKESDDGKAFQGEQYEAGFKDFVVAAKKKFPGLTLDLDSVRLEDLFLDSGDPAAGGDPVMGAKESELTGVGIGKDQIQSTTDPDPIPTEQVPPPTSEADPVSVNPDPTLPAGGDASAAKEKPSSAFGTTSAPS